MGEAAFYHLTRRPLEETLRALLSKARGEGWRVVVRGVDPGLMERLDRSLWMGREEEFLAHGLAGGAHDAEQPILLTTGEDVPNGATCLMSVGGAPVTAEEVASMKRVCLLFDESDERAITAARAQWKALGDQGCTAKYWSEKSGKWKMERQIGAQAQAGGDSG